MKIYDLNLLRVLHHLLTGGSVTAAAERLHLSVPATSHALARLREALGDPLLVRAGRRLVPTPRAQGLREPVARLLAEADALAAAPSAAAMAQTPRHFVVRLPEGMAAVFGAPLLLALQQRLPQATLQLLPESADDPAALREGRIDLDIGHFRPREPELLTLALAAQPLVVAAQPALLGPGRLTLKRYLALRHVLIAPRPREASPIDEALAAQGLQREIALTLPSSHAALMAAARAPLAASVPARTVQAMGPGLGLLQRPLPLEVAQQPLQFAWHPRHAADSAHAWLRDCARRVVEAGGGPSLLRLGRETTTPAPAPAPRPAARRAASGAPGRSAAARARS